MNRSTTLALMLTLLAPLSLAAQGRPAGNRPPRPAPTYGHEPGAGDGIRRLPILNSVWIDELSWIEVRDLIEQGNGNESVLITSGGTEQSGPYLALGKHTIVMRANAEAIARKLGNTLVAPVIPWTPAGDIDPPTSHMLSAGSISLTEATYEAVVTDLARVMKRHGFAHVILMGDHGGNQPGMKAVAERLQKEWAGSKTDIIYVPEYYDTPKMDKWVESTMGIVEKPEGLHDTFIYTAIMATMDPQSVKQNERMHAGLFRINGVELAPMEKTQDAGRKLIEEYARVTVEAIKQRWADLHHTND